MRNFIRLLAAIAELCWLVIMLAFFAVHTRWMKYQTWCIRKHTARIRALDK